jgi:hypothetical protein
MYNAPAGHTDPAMLNQKKIIQYFKESPPPRSLVIPNIPTGQLNIPHRSFYHGNLQMPTCLLF